VLLLPWATRAWFITHRPSIFFSQQISHRNKSTSHYDFFLGKYQTLFVWLMADDGADLF
jgi:hypothetical protein